MFDDTPGARVATYEMSFSGGVGGLTYDRQSADTYTRSDGARLDGWPQFGFVGDALTVRAVGTRTAGEPASAFVTVFENATFVDQDGRLASDLVCDETCRQMVTPMEGQCQLCP